MPGLNLTRDEAAIRSDLLTVSAYDVTLTLGAKEPTFHSRTKVTFDAAEGASTFIDAVTEQVHSIELNGVALKASEVSDGTRIQLANLKKHNELVVEAQMPYMNTGEGLHRFVDPADGNVYLYSQFEVPDSRRVFAVFEQPDLKASFTFTVVVPQEWTVISNQPTPQPKIEQGLATFAFEPTERISSYVSAIIAGPYQSVHSQVRSVDGREIPLGIYARASLAKDVDAENIFTLTRQGFAFYEKEFGRAYPFSKYDQIFAPEFNVGAMENAGAVTIREDYIFRTRVPEALVERRAITILHELAHMWFGDLVTMKWWNDLWLNESFAEYVSTLAAAEATEFTQAWTTFAAREKSWAYDQDQLPSTHPIVAPINDLEDVQVNFDGITYAKGASVLKQLVAWVGQEKFMQGVRSYFEKHAWGNTVLADLLSEFEAASSRNLSEWSSAWLETSQVNTLRPEIATDDSDDSSVITQLSIVQSAVPEHPVLRPQRLALGFYNDDGAGNLVRTARLEVDVAGERTLVKEAVGMKRPALLLINDEDLAYAKIRLDPASWHTLERSLHQVEDSLARNLLWGAAWDATRDAEVPARDFIELAMRHAGSETDSTGLQLILRNVTVAVDLYVNPADRDAIREAVAESLWDLAESAAPGSDRQLQFVKAFALQARSEEQLKIVQELLAGSRKLPELPIDQDLRWELLNALVLGGKAGEKEIAEQERSDQTSSGVYHAALARATVQSPEAKKAAWSAVVKSQGLSNSLQKATIAGFNKVRDPELLAPFTSKYFEQIRKIWRERTSEEARGIVQGLYPLWGAGALGADVIKETENFLEKLGSDAPALRRLVVEKLDGLRRAQAAQHVDS